MKVTINKETGLGRPEHSRENYLPVISQSGEILTEGAWECEKVWQGSDNHKDWEITNDEDSAYDFLYFREVYRVVLPTQTDVKETVEEMPIVNAVRTLVEDHTDYVGDWFYQINKEYQGLPLYETKDFNNSDTRLSLLKKDDKTVAVVIETRTAFNHCEYIFCKKQSTDSISKQQVLTEIEKEYNCQYECRSAIRALTALIKVIKEI